VKIRIELGLSPLDPADDFATMVERVEEAGPNDRGRSLRDVAARRPRRRRRRGVRGDSRATPRRRSTPVGGSGWASARELVSRCVGAGLSKFVVQPTTHPGSWELFVADFAEELSGLKN
jgi:hypothetical protein